MDQGFEHGPGWSFAPNSARSCRSRRRMTIGFSLEPKPPFRLDLTAWALRRRPSNAVDRWDGQTYRRVLMLNGKPCEVAVTQIAASNSPRLQVAITGARLTSDAKTVTTSFLERLLGIRIDLTEFYRLAARDANLDLLAERFRGLKPPRFPTLFEALANGIACQQMSLTLGILLLNRLAEQSGVAVRSTSGSVHAFPRPEELANMEPSEFRKLGFSRQKGRYLIELSRTFLDGQFNSETFSNLGNEAAVERLLELRGVGRWTAEYVLLRGLRRLDVYPGDDVGARNNLQRWLKLKKPLNYESVRRVLAKWQPYAGFIYFHLLLDRLTEAGHLPPGLSS
jgi:DNA-3-methyladenine glycosylase II